MKSNLPSGLNHQKFPLTLTASAFHLLVLQGVVVDGRAGGAVCGRTYDQGGVYAVMQRGEDFFIHAMVEGGEFILNREASVRNLPRLNAMNRGQTMHEVVPPLEDSKVLSYICTFAEPQDKLLWLNWHQTVINAAATEKHLGELITLNQSVNPYLRVDFNDLFPDEFGESLDGIV